MGEWVRVSTFQGAPKQSSEQVEQNTATLREKVLPMAQEISGWKGVLSLIDRESGKGLTLTFWESEEAMRASEEEATRIRKEASDVTDSTTSGVEWFEVALRDLRG